MKDKTLVLELGPGKRPYIPNKKEKVITIDLDKNSKPNIVFDLSKFPWPLKNNIFDKIYVSHVIEHLPDTVKTMEEIYRVAKNNALIIIKVPHFSSRVAWINRHIAKHFLWEHLNTLLMKEINIYTSLNLKFFNIL